MEDLPTLSSQISVRSVGKSNNCNANAVSSRFTIDE
jgi:hypothetical protein